MLRQSSFGEEGRTLALDIISRVLPSMMVVELLEAYQTPTKSSRFSPATLLLAQSFVRKDRDYGDGSEAKYE